MFGEYESESPRVPSPWDSLISSPRSGSPLKQTSRPGSTIGTAPRSESASPRHLSPSPFLLPRLVPENDSGNVEYKLQLLNPSPARFARLVTQLKWRLLEGGGQAYYELGVADSGDLVGLGRGELESSLDTLEMMAGEIGASVIVVKEIEVPAELAVRYEEDAKSGGGSNTWGDARGKRSRRREKGMAMAYVDDEDDGTASLVSSSPAVNTETEDESGGTDEAEGEGMKTTVILQRPIRSNDPFADSMAIFTMDLEMESDASEIADISEIDEDKLVLPTQMHWTVDLEISSVYKPRPMRKRFHHTHLMHQHHGGITRPGEKGAVKEKNKRYSQPQNGSYTNKNHPSSIDKGLSNPTNKSLARRQARDKRREERKKALLALATHGADRSISSIPANDHVVSLDTADGIRATDNLVEKLETLHVDVEPGALVPRVAERVTSSSLTNLPINATDATAMPPDGAEFKIMTRDTTTLDNNVNAKRGEYDGVFVAPPMATPTHESAEVGNESEARLIVEVLVVKKMSVEEGFLDFEGFSFL